MPKRQGAKTTFNANILFPLDCLRTRTLPIDGTYPRVSCSHARNNQDDELNPPISATRSRPLRLIMQTAYCGRTLKDHPNSVQRGRDANDFYEALEYLDSQKRRTNDSGRGGQVNSTVSCPKNYSPRQLILSQEYPGEESFKIGIQGLKLHWHVRRA